MVPESRRSGHGSERHSGLTCTSTVYISDPDGDGNLDLAELRNPSREQATPVSVQYSFGDFTKRLPILTKQGRTRSIWKVASISEK